MAGRPLHLVVATLTAVLAIGSAARPARAQVDTGKAGNKAVRMTPGIDAKTKIRILDSLNRTGTQDGPVAVVPARDTIFFAPPPCGDADTVQIAGPFDPVEVPDVTGMQENDAHILLGRRGLNFRSREVPLNRTTGVVFAQATPAGTRVAPGTRVKLCWAGPAEVPDVRHTTRAAAEQVLKAAGYEPAEQEGATLKTALVGKVTEQDPPAHARADSGSTVTITVGVPTIVDVPPVVGQPAKVATRTLEARHLWARLSGAKSDSAVVESQVPRAHTRVNAWSRVDLTMTLPAVPVKPTKPGGSAPPKPPPQAPRGPWPWMVLLALAGTAAAAALVREVKSPRRVRAIQTMAVRDVGSQTLTVVHDEPDAELRRLGFELRPVLDAGTQRLHPEAVLAGKERAGA